MHFQHIQCASVLLIQVKLGSFGHPGEQKLPSFNAGIDIAYFA